MAWVIVYCTAMFVRQDQSTFAEVFPNGVWGITLGRSQVAAMSAWPGSGSDSARYMWDDAEIPSSRCVGCCMG